MKWPLYFGIALRIIILFAVGMFGTYIPDYLRGFFGDVYTGDTSSYLFKTDTEWDWGARHYWYFWMMFVLFILSIANLIVSIVRLIRKYYPDSI